MQFVSHFVTFNDSLQELSLTGSSISNDELITLCSSLKHSSVTKLWLHNNEGITSKSSYSLYGLLCKNKLSEVSLLCTSLTELGIFTILYGAKESDTLQTLHLDLKFEGYCSQHSYFELVKQKLVFYSP